MNTLSKRLLLVEKIRAEIDLERLTELLAEDFMQQAAHDLKVAIDDAERG